MISGADRPARTDSSGSGGGLRPRLLSVATRLRALSVAASEPVEDIESVERRIAGMTFQLFVVGEYKRGKSTLVNALLGKSLLPAGVLPLTSIPTEVAFGTTAGARVEYQSGETATVPLDRLYEYVTEPGNPGNARRVRRVLVQDAAPLLAEGVTIVDLPGTGSIHGESTRVTYESLEQADAVVFVLAADQPIGNEEARLLQALLPSTDRILFVVNRVDLLTPAELDEALAFTRRQLVEACARRTITLHPLSARLALTARLSGETPPADFVRFAEALHRLLVEDKEEIVLEKSRRLLTRVCEQLEFGVEAELAAARMESGEIDRAIATLKDAARDLRAREGEARALLRHGVGRLESETLRGMEEQAARTIRESVWPRVEAALAAGDEESLPATTHQLAEEVGDWVVDGIGAYYPASEGLVTAEFTGLLDAYERRLSGLMEESARIAAGLIGVRSTIPAETISLASQPRFHLKSWDFAGGVLPRSAAFRLRLPGAMRYARRCLAELTERRIRQNLAAVRSDWMRRMDDALWQLEAANRRRLESVGELAERALHRAVEGRRLMEPQRRARQEHSAEALRELAACRSELRRAPPDECV